MAELAEAFRALGDGTRLRIVRVLLEESLNVGELTRILGLAQPTVSKHLAELKRAGLVEGNRTSGYRYYTLVPTLGAWWESLVRDIRQREDTKGDLVRLGEVLRQRRERAASPDRFVVPGRSWAAWSRALGYLLPPLRVADFGCGDGAFTLEMSAWARHVWAIDCNPRFLALARERCSRAGNITFLGERMEQVSLPDRSVDLVVISQALHYLEQPPAALAEAHRILVPGGRVLVLELLPHHEEWVVSKLHHVWMGFTREQLREWLEGTGYCAIELRTPARPGPQAFQTLTATALRRVPA